jgi:hypothetical protein
VLQQRIDTFMSLDSRPALDGAVLSDWKKIGAWDITRTGLDDGARISLSESGQLYKGFFRRREIKQFNAHQVWKMIGWFDYKIEHSPKKDS